MLSGKSEPVSWPLGSDDELTSRSGGKGEALENWKARPCIVGSASCRSFPFIYLRGVVSPSHLFFHELDYEFVLESTGCTNFSTAGC